MGRSYDRPRMFALGRHLWIVALLAPLVGSGCMHHKRSDYRSAHAISVADRSDEADRVWDAIGETLRRHRFRLDRVDRRAGLVTTTPETSQHFFEFWRHDVATWTDAWQASLNPLRRRAEVTVARADEGRWTQLSVAVFKERLSSPDRQFNNTAAAYQFFGESLPSTTGDPKVTPEDERWLDQGRDAAMEDHLLRAILERAGLERRPEPTS